MSSAGTALDQLLAALRGHPHDPSNWDAVIALANLTLLTPTLHAALESGKVLERISQDAAAYLELMAQCNRERNLRLREQLHETVAALNRHGIEPLLLKGTVPLFGEERDPLPTRITSDLDLAVEAGEEAVARNCLRAIGYASVPGGREMVRPHDAALVDLRRNMQPSGLGPPTFVERAGLRVRVPSGQSRMLHLIVHDLLKEGDHWRGKLDLRHLHDLATLAESERPHWRALRGFMLGRSAGTAFDTQLLALSHLFAVPVPTELIETPVVRLHYWRRLFPARHPLLGWPLRLAGNLTWGMRRALRAGDLGRGGPIVLARRTAQVLFHRRGKI